jgi:hypothetical protein
MDGSGIGVNQVIYDLIVLLGQQVVFAPGTNLEFRLEPQHPDDPISHQA